MANFVLIDPFLELRQTLKPEIILLLIIPIALLGIYLLHLVMRSKKPYFPSFEGKHVFITGGSSGIGLATAKRALLEGSFVTITGRNKGKLEEALDMLIKETKCSEDRLKFMVADVADYEAISASVKTAFEWRPIDVLICNAGIASAGYIDELPIKQHEAVLNTNVFGSFYTIHAALPFMKKYSPRHSLSIVIIGSTASLYLLYGNAAYTASKYAVRGLAEALQLELLPYNIQVNLICPGFVNTPFLDSVEIDHEFDKLLEQIDLYKRENANTPDKIARLTLNAVRKGKFLVTTKEAVPSLSLVTVGRGFTPSGSMLINLLELVTHPFVRIASWIHAWKAKKLILEYHQRKIAQENKLKSAY